MHSKPMLSAVIAFAMATLVLTASLATAQESQTFGAVKSRGSLVCGISGTNAVFALAGSDGVIRGLEVDECRAIAAAVLGDPSRYRLVALPPQSRLVALQSGEVDVLFSNTTMTLGREANSGVEFAAIYFYDGQGFMTKQSSHVQTPADLDGASICMPAGGTAEQNVADYFRVHGMKLTPVLIESPAELRQSFLAGRCDALTGDSSSLASFHRTMGIMAADYVILPELIGSEPLASAVRKGDDRWLDIVRWTHNALVMAEALGVTAANAEQQPGSQDPAVRRLLGSEGNLGQEMGLDKQWAYFAIRSVGNFGEMWERSVTPTGLARGLNQIWTKGGLMYSAPFR